LQGLVAFRIENVPEGYRDVGEFTSGADAYAFVSPYSKVAHGTDSSVLIMLQDWISEDVISSSRGPEALRVGRLADLPTNKNLDRFVEAHLGLRIGGVFATNLGFLAQTAENMH